MKIFAFRYTCIQDGRNVNGVSLKVGLDGHEQEAETIKEAEEYAGVKEGSVKIKQTASMSLKELAQELKPEFEKLVKTAAIKSDLLDAISKLPIN